MMTLFDWMKSEKLTIMSKPRQDQGPMLSGGIAPTMNWEMHFELP